jgi:hypothetical protein
VCVLKNFCGGGLWLWPSPTTAHERINNTLLPQAKSHLVRLTA